MIFVRVLEIVTIALPFYAVLLSARLSIYPCGNTAEKLADTFLNDIVLQALSFVAENERVNIRQRQAEVILELLTH